ncbi:MAG: hypothetical protein JEZ02_00170 [Desulfatibacillum sp.]|nr:hypothetical protein [Desulfatibacillum sp.]
MEWEDLFDEYGYSDDPDGVLGEPRSISSSGISEELDEDWFMGLPGDNHEPATVLHP